MSGARFDANATSVNTVNSTINLGSVKYQTGDQVTYSQGGDANQAVGGLADGSTYYLHKELDGTFSFYDTKDHAQAGGSTGQVAITSTGTGSGQSFVYGNQKSD